MQANAPGSPNTTVQIRRVHRQAARFREATILVDGRPSGSVADGNALSVAVPPGAHPVEITLGSAGSPALEVVLEPGKEAVFECEVQTGWTGPRIDLRSVETPAGISVRQAASQRGAHQPTPGGGDNKDLYDALGEIWWG